MSKKAAAESGLSKPPNPPLTTADPRMDSSDKELLIRLDDRSQRIEAQLVTLKQELRQDFARQTAVIDLRDRVAKLEDRSEDLPVLKKIVFGFVGVILLAVAGAIVALVLRE